MSDYSGRLAGGIVRSDSSTLIAEVYDFDKPIDRHYDDVAYYVCLLTGVSGRVLELASGTGRFLIPLLEAGVAAEGLDHSLEMLDVCRRHCEDRGLKTALHSGDMAAFDLPRAYEMVIMPSGAIKELIGRDAALQALACCRKVLVPGGRLVVDVVPPRLVTEHGPMRYWQRGSDLWTQQVVHLDYDSAANRTIKLQRYEKWHDSVLVRAEMHRFCLQHWTLQEFHGLLAEAGFTDVSVMADYQDGVPPGPDDDDWTFHATSP